MSERRALLEYRKIGFDGEGDAACPALREIKLAEAKLLRTSKIGLCLKEFPEVGWRVFLNPKQFKLLDRNP